MKNFVTIVAILFCSNFTFSACSFDDDERCAEGYTLVDDTCVEDPEDRSSELDSSVAAGGTSGNEDAGGSENTDDNDAGEPPATVTGLGEACDTTDADPCAGNEADYCLAQPPATEGECTVKECTLSPDSCPADYFCCDFTFTEHTICFPEQMRATIEAMCN